MRLRHLLPLVPLALAACGTTWTDYALQPQPSPVTLRGPVRVWRADGSAIVLSSATIRGDSLYGTLPHPANVVGLATSTSDVRKVETGTPSATLPALGIVAALAYGLYEVFLHVTN
jgi:hypothetical protein